MATTLQSLIRYLDSLQGPAPLPELADQLRQLTIAEGEVSAQVRFSDRHYTRNLVQGSDWYHLLVLCWKNGQRSPIHDHKGSNCGVRVLRGTLTETRFEFAPNGLVRAANSTDHAPGSVLASHDQDMHQISNLQAGDAELITLHIYSPPLFHMGTYSLTTPVRGTEPMFPDYCDAGGI